MHKPGTPVRVAAPSVSDVGPSPAVLVTGASRGIGAATARALARGGCRLLLSGRASQDLQELAGELGRAGADVGWVAADLCETGSAEHLVRSTVDRFGLIDALVCNAGVLHVGALEDATDEDILNSVSLNLLAPMRLARAALVPMKQRRKGRIVFVASTFAFVSAPHYTLYSASKAGVVGLTRSLAVELASRGVQVNAVAPGQVRTEMIASALQRFGEDRIAATIPARRIGEAAEIAGVIRYLVLDAPDFMTGDVMMVDGGYVCQ
jgi:3-oxoacyl-[acyl-carrier protein] reductase